MRVLTSTGRATSEVRRTTRRRGLVTRRRGARSPSPSKRGEGLWLDFTHTPALKGPLEPYDGETFRTRFPDKREEDAFVTFGIATARPATATVKGVSPDIDFSYDYQDLRLTRV